MKETNELIDGVVEAVKAGKKIRDILADGATMADVPAAFELIKEQSAKLEIYSAAAKDAKLAIEELKDLDKEEIIGLVMKLVSAVSEIEKA